MRSLFSRTALLALSTLCCLAQGTGTLKVYFSPPAAQSSTVSGVATETFDALSTGVSTTAYTSTGVGTYTGSSTNPYAILAHDQYGGATDSTHSSPTNYLAVGVASSSSAPVILTLSQPAAYFGFWWSAGDASNRIDLYQGATLFATFSTADLLTFLNNGTGTITALNGTTTYNTSAYYGNPNITSGANDSAEPFVYISFVITGATIDKLAFYNTSATGSTFESDNHSVIFTGNTVTIPTSFVLVETLNLTPTAATPTFSPVAGSYTSVQSVTISSATSGTSIRYTTDGSTPSETAGTLYSAAVTVNATETLKAIAYGSGLADSAVASAAYVINLPTTATPTFSPSAGTYTSVQAVTISSATSGASIRYMTDGSTPSETAGTIYSGTVTVGATETLKAIAYKSGMNDSAVATAAYTISLPVVATPTFSPVAGTYTSAQTVTISTTTSGASIRYTTDGSTPSQTSGTLYSTAVTVGATETLRAIAYASGMTDSAVASAAYTITPPVAAPTFSPAAGTYASAQTVTISTTTSGASIRYTTDGSTPTETVGTLYSSPVTVSSTETLMAIAYKSGMSDSTVASAAYTITPPATTPTFSPVAGTYTSAQTVTISTTTSGASIRYTTDGSTPSETVGTPYSAPVTVSSTETLMAIAYKSGMSDSAVASAAYTITPPVAAPTFSPVAGTYTSSQTVTISTTTAGASIRYTTDGSTPSETVGTLYSAPITVSSSETVKAIAYATGLTDSAVATAAYTVSVSVTVSPISSTLLAGQTQQFTASVVNTSNTNVTWSLNPAGVGSVSATGLYTPPSCISSQQSVTIIATSVVDNTKNGSATVTLQPAPAGYGYFRTVIIDHTKVPNTDQTNFPFLFSITDPAFATTANGGHVTNANGYDLIFSSDPGGALKLHHEVEQYNPVTGQVIAWVRIPTLSHTSDTTLYVFYGNTAVTADQSSKTGVWDSNFTGVWHFANTSGAVGLNDSTSGAHTLANANQLPVVAGGEVGSGAQFNGSNQALSVPLNLSNTSLVTVSFWTNWNAFSNNDELALEFTPNSNNSNGGFAVDPNGSGGAGAPSGFFQVGMSDGSGHYSIGDFARPSAAAWHFYSFTFDRSTASHQVDQSMYMDGVNQTTQYASSNAGIGTFPNSTLYLMSRGGSSLFGAGILDEFRLSNSKRSPDWIATEYNNQSSPSAFYTILPESSSFFVSPSTATLGASQTQQFTATFVNSCNSSVTWSIAPAGTGAITTGGFYNAPATIASQQAVTVTATSVTDNTKIATAVVTLVPPVSVSPTTATLFSNQTKQFTATVSLSNTAVTWTINPSTTGSISASGLYTAPCVATQQIVTVTAISVADPSKTASATVTLQPTPVSYGYFRTVVIDHTKVPNTDQAKFPFLFSITDPALATTANGGHLTNANGYDLVFASDSGGTVKLDYELEKYNSVTGQVTAWVRIPTLSHTSDTALYVFYGNAATVADQSNRTGVWDTNFKGVWHFSNATAVSTQDATVNGNNGTINGVPSVISGEIGWAANFAGSNDNLAIQRIPLSGADYTISTWFKTPLPVTGSWNTLTRGSVSDHQVIVAEGNWHLGAYYGGFQDSGFAVNSLANGWHYLVSATVGSTTSYFVDGTLVGTIPFRSNDDVSFLGNYQGNGQQFGGTDEIRISTGLARSADWIATEYNNQSSPSSFYTILPESTSFFVSPSTATLGASQTQQFTATFVNNCSSGATWSVTPAGVGTITAGGLYTAPATIASQQVVTVKATSVADGISATGVVMLVLPISVSPTTATLFSNQTKQFTAIVGLSNPAVTWTINPSTVGSISASGLYTAPPCVTTQQMVTVTATSVADSTKSASAIVTLRGGSPYGYHRAVIIDHTKVPNTDQTNFPFLFSVANPTFATIANGGHVTSANGFDIIFSFDPSGSLKLDHELEQYNPVTGQVTAWVRIPALSHTNNTTLYVFYGNSAITTDQSNRTGVWDANFSGVLHLANGTALSASDSTSNGNAGTIASSSAVAGYVDGAASFNGTSSYISLPQGMFGYPTSGNTSSYGLSFETWFKTAGSGGIVGQTNGGLPGSNPNGNVPALYLDNSGYLRASFFWHGGVNQIISARTYNDNNWHHAVDTYSNGTETLYIDGVAAGSQTVTENSYSSVYNYFVGSVQTSGWPNGNGTWYYLNGVLDEVRVSIVGRSADWIATEYNNQSSPSTFYSLNPENAPVNVAPLVSYLYASQTEQLMAVASSCVSSTFTWSIPSNAPGTITAGGLYTAPASIASQQAVTATATNQSDATTGTATVNLMPPIGIGVSPPTATLPVGQTQQFTAIVTNGVSNAVTWSIFPNIGTISPAGLYAAPASVTNAQSVTVTATSVMDSTKSATSSLVVVPFASAPVFSPPPGVYAYSPPVTISSASSGASIRYTIDGSTPTETHGTLYSVPIPVSSAMTINAIAYGSGMADSTVTSGAYSLGSAASTAHFQFVDPATEGSWQGVYGKDGYNVIGGTTSYPGYVTVTGGVSPFIWNSSTSDPRALEAASTGTNRVAGTWAGGAFNIDLNFTDGALHQVGLYLLDWDNLKRGDGIAVVDAGTNTILDYRNASSFANGQYWVWTFTGHVIFRITQTGAGNAAISGLFFDPPGLVISPTAVTVAPYQTQQFSAIVTSSSNQAVTWSVSPSLGTISSTGLYTGPASLATEQIVTVSATSVADTSKSASSTVTLLPGVTGGAGGSDISLIAASLCRHPHVGPTVSAGGPIDLFMSCNGSQCSPVSATVQGSALTYTLVPGFALTYSWSLVSGPAPVQVSSPTSTSSNVTFTVAGNYTLQFEVNDGIATGSAFAHLYVASHGNGNGQIFLTPSVSGPNAVNKPVSIQATFRNNSFVPGAVIPNSTINMTVTGANPQTGTIVTDSNGTATFTYTGTNPGTDTIVGVNPSGNNNGNVTSEAATVTWIADPPKLTSSPVTGQFFPADGTGSFNITSAQTPLFTQIFPAIDFDPAAGTVPGNTSGVTNQTRPFTDMVTDRTGSYVGAIVAQGDGYQAGTGPLYNFGAVFTGTLNVPTAGQVTFTITGDDAFIFGVGNSATRVSGPQTNTPATSPFNNYPVMGGVNQRSAPAASTIAVNFPAAGVYPYELDYAKGGDNKLTLTMLASGAPIPAAALLTLTPATAPSITAGQVQQLTLTATDADGAVLSNVPVTFSVTGTNVQTRLLTTNGVGQVDFAYVGEQFLTGVDTVQAAARINGADAYSNAVVVTWNSGTNLAPVVSAGSNQTINLPSQAILSGSVSDDGLPNNALTVTWSMQSGPAAVVFDNPSQASTAVAFSATGTYVMLLTASDGTLTSTSAVTIGVNAPTTWNTGWIANPLNESSVSGQVPITLIPGITLTSGTLTFYPANNQSAITTISATTTGTGQIAIFDTTLVNNGSYFVDLRATNSAGVTQDNLVLVTVVGNYKPGRVTATVTDLTVPAAGLSIQVQRTYDSLLKSQSSDFGFGWQLGLNAVNITTSITGDVTLTIGGQRHTFYFTPQSSFFAGVYTPQFTAEPGFYGSLSGQNDNCNGLLLHVGNIFECYLNNGGQSYQPQTYTYTDPYGRVYTLSPTGALQSLKDLNGNTLTLSSTGITSSTGLSIPFVRDSQGRITQITDATGHIYTYTYDTSGNLSTVTLPGITQPTTYGYDSTHLLTSEQDPRGHSGSTSYYPNGQLKSITDAAGQITSYAYNPATNSTTVTNPDLGTVITVTDAYGMPLTVTDPLGRVTTNTYDTKHNLLTTTDPLGKVTTYTYDTNGFRTSLKDPLNNVWGATYNPVGGPLTVTNPLNQTQTVTYDTSFRISTITDTIGSVAGFTYNTQGQPLTLQDARGNTSHYAYDAYGNRTSYTDPLNRTTTSVFNNSGWMTSQTDPRTHQTQYGYDSLGRKTSTTDANGKITQYAYDANNNKISETDPLNRTTTYAYDNVNRMTGITYPDTTTKSFTYDFRGNKLTETDQLGRVTKNVYDLAGQLTSTTVAFGTPDAVTTSYTYDLDGRKLTQTDPRNNTTTYTYDDAGRLTSTKDAIGNITQYGYDAKGQRTSLTDAKNRVTTYTYDSRGRQLTTTTPDTKTVTKTYDGLGLVLTTQDEENRTTTFGYDAASQLTSVTDALSQITHYTYDPAGNKLTQVDANNHTTSYAWDNLNRRTSRTLPASQTESFTYDDVGNMATRVDFNGKTTTYAYDTLNRLLSRTPDASFSASPVSFTYTSTGQRLTMIDPSGTTTYTYTNRDQVATKATPQGTLTYIYDLAGNVASTLSSNTNGTSVTYAWDVNNRLSGVTDSRLAGATTTYTYDATNQLSTMTYPNAVVHSYSYDTRDRALTLNGYTQTFSPSGRKQSVTEASGRAANYGYDNIYRLLNETISGDPTSANNGALTYVLDPVGNRQSLTSTLAALTAQSFTYDADDRISGDAFDANGNTLTSGGVTYTYDFEDRLLTTSSGVTIVYDGDGNRVSENTTKYLVDDQTPTGYAQVAEELVSGAVTAQFTYGPMRISQRRTATSYYGYDAGGSVRQLFDNTGTVTDTYAYDAFGNTVAQAGSTVNEFQYRGEQYDASLQMYYFRARYYASRTGRFLTADRYEGGAVGACDCSNRSRIVAPRGAHHFYEYSDADPINLTDPSGKDIVSYSILFGRGELQATYTAVRIGGFARCALGLEILLAKLSTGGINVNDPWTAASLVGLTWSCASAFGIWPFSL